MHARVPGAHWIWCRPADSDSDFHLPSTMDQEKQDVQDKLQVKTPSSNPLELPSPITAQAPKSQTAAKYKLSAVVIIPIWIVLSSSVIMYNNYVYNTRKFEFPVFLVTWHLGFAAVGTRILQRTTNLLDGAKDVHMTKEMFVRSILPIGLLFSGSLILSNTAYLYLSVPYIQMLKVIHLFRQSLELILDPVRRLHLWLFSLSRGLSAFKTQTRNWLSLYSWSRQVLLSPHTES